MNWSHRITNKNRTGISDKLTGLMPR